MDELLARHGIEIDAGDGGWLVRGGDRDWLRAVLVAFGLPTRVEVDGVFVVTRERTVILRGVGAAIAPEALLFDLDGVLADISGRSRIADPEDVARLAKHFPIGVVTTCPRRLAESVLERHGFLPNVHVVVGSEDGPCKPDPFPVRLALQQLGKCTAWMLGDNPSDVTAARGGGAVPFAIRPRGIGAESHEERLRAAGAVQLVRDVAEFGERLGEQP